MAKGSDFERKRSKYLSLWYTDGERDDLFWHTSGSGARQTMRKKKGLATANSAGDLMAMDLKGQVFVDYFLIEFKRGYTAKVKSIKEEDIEKLLEIKDSKKALNKARSIFAKARQSGKSVDILSLVDSTNKEHLILDWWQKAKDECIFNNRQQPLIFFRRDKKEACLVLSSLFLREIEDEIGSYKKNVIELFYDKEELAIVKADEFFEYFRPEHFKIFAKALNKSDRV